MNNGDTPAMPQDSELHCNEIGLCPTLGQGVTKREYFAGLAMQGLCAQGGYATSSDLAYDAVKLADSLLKELNK